MPSALLPKSAVESVISEQLKESAMPKFHDLQLHNSCHLETKRIHTTCCCMRCSNACELSFALWEQILDSQVVQCQVPHKSPGPIPKISQSKPSLWRARNNWKKGSHKPKAQPNPNLHSENIISFCTSQTSHTGDISGSYSFEFIVSFRKLLLWQWLFHILVV